MSNIKLGSVNFPKLMRHVGHRTNQVRDLVFMRDAIQNKSTITTQNSKLSNGPAVNFGYEKNTNTTVASDASEEVYRTRGYSEVLPRCRTRSRTLKILLFGCRWVHGQCFSGELLAQQVLRCNKLGHTMTFVWQRSEGHVRM